MRVDEVELRIVSLPFRSPVLTSYGVVADKVAVLATVRAEGIEGYGEGVMEPLPLYREETVEGALTLLRRALVPWLVAREVVHPEDLTDAWRGWRGNPMAKATLEHAVWDCYARQQGLPLSKVLGGSGDAVAVGASLGMAPVPETIERETPDGRVATGEEAFARRQVLHDLALDITRKPVGKTNAGGGGWGFRVAIDGRFELKEAFEPR